jgi:hypothetical protein
VTPTEVKLHNEKQQALFMLAAIVEWHGGFLVLEKNDLSKIDPNRIALLIQDGPQKDSILLKVVKT